MALHSWGAFLSIDIDTNILTGDSMFWMMVIARGIAGFGAGGEYPVCATSSTEAADETEKLRKQRGILVAVTTDFAIDLVCSIGASIQAVLMGLGICHRWHRGSHCFGMLSPA